MNVSRLQPLAQRHALAVESELAVKARYVLSQAVGHSTLASYDRRFGVFIEWCLRAGVRSLPAAEQDVGRFFLSSPSKYSATTLVQIRTAIKMHHLRAGFQDPTGSPYVQISIEERLRARGTSKHKEVLYFEDFLRVIDCIGTSSVVDLRDRAILLSAFFGALRIWHLRQLRVDRRTPHKDGMLLHFDSSTRPVVRLRRIAQVRFCPVAAIQSYLSVADITYGPIFVACNDEGPRLLTPLSGRTLINIVRKRCEAAGLARAATYTVDSLFAGFVVAGHEVGMRMSELIVRTGLRSRAINRYKQFARSKSPLPGSYVTL